jgi:hypothetical protein
LVIETLSEKADWMCVSSCERHIFFTDITAGSDGYSANWKLYDIVSRQVCDIFFGSFPITRRNIQLHTEEYKPKPGDASLCACLFQCLTVAVWPLCLAEVLAFDFEEAPGGIPELNVDWRREDQERAVLSTCSSLITMVHDGEQRVVQFSHFSVKEFLMSDRLAIAAEDNSFHHIAPTPAHTILAQACLGVLLRLDDSTRASVQQFPLAKYAL